jgi:mannose-6-phosphate isomerase-like protein (cupin superfamily)
MKVESLSTMTGGWFVGSFSPAVLRSADIECAVKYYRRGDKEPRHHHKLAAEITVIASGRVRMCDREFAQGDIVCLDPGEATSFEALEDAVTVVVKHPSVPADKYLD